jgi:hypothetical protein
MLSEKLKDKIKNINFTKTLDVFYIYNKMNPDTQLNLNEIIILNLIISYEMIGQKCHLNYEQLGEKICKNEKTAKTAIKGLKEKGLIDWKP